MVGFRFSFLLFSFFLSSFSILSPLFFHICDELATVLAFYEYYFRID